VNYKTGFFVLLFILFALLVYGCSTRDQARFEGVINLGDLPEDMLYVDGVPQANASTESDGDVVLSYVSDDAKFVGQLYGCAYISLNCGQLYMQGRYEWNIPASVKGNTPGLYREPRLTPTPVHYNPYATQTPPSE